MRRGIRPLAAALEYVAELRRLRFHDAEAVFVLDDATGEQVEASGSKASPQEDEPPSEAVDLKQLACATSEDHSLEDIARLHAVVDRTACSVDRTACSVDRTAYSI